MKKFTLFVFVLMSVYTNAQDGFPDPSFGNGGFVSTILSAPIFDPQNGPGGSVTVWPTYSAFEKNGRLTVVKARQSVVFVIRYDNNGRLDHSFNGGIVAHDFTHPYYLFTLKGVGVQPDGNVIIVAGARSGTNDARGNKLILIRFTKSGVLDHSFGNNGVIEVVPSFNVFDVPKMGIRSDGSIVLVTQRQQLLGNERVDFTTRIYDANGVPIGGGIGNFTPPDLPILPTRVGALHLQEDGKIVVGALGSPAAPNLFSILQRYNASGPADPSFGQSGVVIDVTLGGIPQAIATQKDGKIIVAVGTRFFRFNVRGTRDLTFGNNGVVESPFPALGILVQADGKIVTAGTYNAPGASGHFLVARYDPDGKAFDPSFGYGGMGVISLTSKTVDVEAVQIADNRIYVYGGGFLAAFKTSSSPMVANPVSGVQRRAIGEKIEEQKLSAIVSPNPATTHFVLRLQGTSNKPMQVRIYDAVGRTIELKRNVTAGNTLRLGDSYRPGIYYAEVVQGNERRTLKLIKASR